MSHAEQLAVDDHILALQEVLNIGAGNAARILSEILEGKNILLGIPEVCLLKSPHDMKSLFEEQKGSFVSLKFSGIVSGQNILHFSPEHSNTLVRMLVDDLNEEDETEAFEEEVLSEVGNIVINGVIGAIGNLLETNFSYQIPVYSKELDINKILFESKKDVSIVSCKISFQVADTTADCYMQLCFLSDDLNRLTTAALEFFEE